MTTKILLCVHHFWYNFNQCHYIYAVLYLS